MENLVVPVQLKDPEDGPTVRVSARLADRKPRTFTRCSCCRNDLDSNHHRAAPAAKPSRKRKRTSVAPPSTSPAPQHPAHDADSPAPVLRPKATIQPDQLPTVSSALPGLQPSIAPQLDDGPVKIHHFSVPQYQSVYHSVVDDVLQYKNGRLRPYSMTLGLLMKQKLWERLDRPMFSETVDEKGLIHVDIAYGVGVYPPLYHVDVSGEPEPGAPLRKRVKN